MMERKEVMEGCMQDNLQWRAIWTKKYEVVCFLFSSSMVCSVKYILSLHENDLLNDLLKCQLFICVFVQIFYNIYLYREHQIQGRKWDLSRRPSCLEGPPRQQKEYLWVRGGSVSMLVYRNHSSLITVNLLLVLVNKLDHCFYLNICTSSLTGTY